jgi:hypothetical protein
MFKRLTLIVACAFGIGFGNVANAGSVGISVVFSDHEAAIIRAYYRDQGADHGGPKGNRGNKGRKTLPPGIARNLQRGKPLPPGIAKQVLPAGLIALLPPAPKGHERIVVAGKILLVEVATQVVRDVIEDIVFG